MFAKCGYEAASMEEIAEASGITPAVIYDHFPSKAMLQVELLEGQTAVLLEYVGAALDGAPNDPAVRMRVGVDSFFRFVEEHRFAWRMLVRDPPGDPEVATAYLQLENQASEAIAGFIEARAGDALVGYEDPHQVVRMFAEALKAGQNGLAAWWYEHPEVPRKVVVDRMLEFCWFGLERVAQSGAREGR